MKTNRSHRAGIAALMFTSFGNLHAMTTLIEDDFFRFGNLGNSTTNTGQTWSGGGTWSVTGSDVSVNQNGTARVNGLNLLPNSTYQFSFDVTMTSQGNSPIGFGFSDSSEAAIQDQPYAMWFRGLNTTSNPISVFSQTPGGGNLSQAIFGSVVFPSNVELTLETGNDLANSTASLSVNGSFGSPTAVDASSVDGILIQSLGGRGTFDNIKLIGPAPVPEPSSAILFALGAASVIGRRRRA